MKPVLLIAFFAVVFPFLLTAEDRKPSVEFKPYGYIELYGIASDTLMAGPDLLIYAKDDTKEGLYVTARTSRIGTKILFPSIGTISYYGVLEVDFLADLADSGGAESRPLLRLRHAYFDIKKTFGDSSVGFIAGNTWSVATMTFFPNMINPLVGQAMGNIWQRLPQIQFYFNKKLDKHNLTFKMSASEPMTGASLNRGKLLAVDYDPGGASFMPLLETSLTFNGDFGNIKLFTGISGAYGKEDYSSYTNGATIGRKKVDVQLFSAVLKLNVPYAQLSGRFYTGKNIDVYGAQTGSALAKGLIEGETAKYEVLDSVSTMGFFSELTVYPLKKKTLEIVGSMGFDDPDEDQENAAVAYHKNTYYLGGIYYTMFDRFRTGFNYMRITKESTKDITSNHFLFSFRFTF